MKTGVLVLLVLICFACSNISNQNKNLQKRSNLEKNESMEEFIKRAKSGDSEALEDIWKFTFELPQWYFPCRYKENVNDAMPFVGVLDGKPLLFAFTDSKKAQEFAKTQGLANKIGETLILSKTPTNTQIFLDSIKAEGVIGIYFNNGPDGWFSEIDELPNILKSLKVKGKI